MKHFNLPGDPSAYSFRKCLTGVITALVFLAGCYQPAPRVDKLFTLLTPNETHIDFSNQLSFDENFNIYTYRNFYNGGGVAIGDINNDGLPDIFFTSNMQQNRLFMNTGNFTFRDITGVAGIQKKGKWSTGVSMADINGDGFLDIYVCNSGDIKGDNKQNELYINDGHLHFTEQAHAYGLDDRGYSTHAAFFDYDHDGDLDMFLLNNSFKLISSFNLQHNERNVRDSAGGDKLFRNDGGHFKDISAQAGVYGSRIAFGLGISVGDINNDGWQDIYVSNDFFERDYLYVNNKDGTFKECLEEQMNSISYASMGSDIADINNDGYADLFTSEMLPSDEARLKTNTTFESWDKYQLNLKYDYYQQFSRNMLQLNNGNGTFSEIGRYAGVEATDWSWGALMTDLDNDGFKDIFISNGIYQDLTNGDYIQYISDPQFMHSILTSKERNRKLIAAMHSTPISNCAYRNNGNLTFADSAAAWGLDDKSFSNGAAYGDLDNDGDLDLVVNNVNMEAFVYRNNSVQLHPDNKFLKVKLQGKGMNRYATGAKVTVYANHTIIAQEQMPTRGFQSTVDNCLNFGLGKAGTVDSVMVRWPDNSQTTCRNVRSNQTLVMVQSLSAKQEQLTSLEQAKKLFGKSEDDFGIDFVHHENEYSDFDRERLIFQMLSTEGPGICKADVNGDGREDIYFGGAKDQPGALYIQLSSGRFIKTNEKVWERDRGCEDTGCLFFDADGDGDQDLFVCSGGNEFSSNSAALADRLYFNNGKGNFTKSPQLLPDTTGIYQSSSCVDAADFDGDGDLDLVVGIRLKPMAYGYPCKAYILQNNGKGVFSDITEKICPAMDTAGMITDAKWFDYDRDGHPDLVIAGEYMPIRIYHNINGKFNEQTIDAGLKYSNGWWNKLAVADVNNDGYPDIIAANHGLNSRFRAAKTKPVTMYAGDFDNSGRVQQIIACYSKNKQYPMALRHDMVSVLPALKKKYLTYEQYKEQTVTDIFTTDQLKNAWRSDAYQLNSCVLLNNTNGTFSIKALPGCAQFSPMYAIAVDDYDDDGFKDIIAGGNFFQSKPEAGIYDASYGLLLKGDGKGNFSVVNESRSGIHIKGAVRAITSAKIKNKKILIAAMNNEAPKLFRYEK
ncbi:MAG: VCBS repeat-containing protein [Chitinophagaceae bacterium]|nr:VCBS repeat-containing protein [Chitinophagaceae bacterium]